MIDLDDAYEMWLKVDDREHAPLVSESLYIMLGDTRVEINEAYAIWSEQERAERRHKCTHEDCKYATSLKARLLLHMITHDPDRPTFDCSKCARPFKTALGLHTHRCQDISAKSVD